MVDLGSRPAPTPFSEHTGLLGVRVMESINISLFRLSKGHVGGQIFGEPVILLTTTGRTSGINRTKPLLALRDRAAWIVVGSRGGTREHPQWYRNLVAYRDQPDRFAPPTVEAADNLTTVIEPEVLTGDDYDDWWHKLVEVYPKFQAYQDRTPDRVIPVIRLTPKH